ncbi:MAG TPA: gliding motility lipoprotein GldD [Chitinophagales bacterium]
MKHTQKHKSFLPQNIVLRQAQYVTLFAAFFLVFLSACNGDYSPKPKAYPRVVYPEKKYETYVSPDCPFEFEKPVYAKIARDSSNNNPCWINVEFPDFNGTINLTYKAITPKDNLPKLIEDAHKMSFKHAKKANYIDEVLIENKNGVGGILYNVGGDAASNIQFFLTDTTHHFIRGALYFNNEPNTDSMAPVINFVRADLDSFLASFKWK